MHKRFSVQAFLSPSSGFYAIVDEKEKVLVGKLFRSSEEAEEYCAIQNMRAFMSDIDALLEQIADLQSAIAAVIYQAKQTYNCTQLEKIVSALNLALNSCLFD